jgi:hypothetical protein
MAEGCPAQPEAEPEIHSFILKLWREHPAWNGHITHVPSGARRSVRGFEDIVGFIALYIDADAAGVQRRIDRRAGDGA